MAYYGGRRWGLRENREAGLLWTSRMLRKAGHAKTARIHDLQRQVDILNRQLVEARNLVNTLDTQVKNLERVQYPAKSLRDEFRPKLWSVAKPPPPPPPLSPLLTPLTHDDDWETVEEEEVSYQESNLENVTSRTLIMDIIKK